MPYTTIKTQEKTKKYLLKRLLRLLLEVTDNKFEEVLNKQKEFDDTYEDDLIDIGVLKNSAIKKVKEFEDVTGNKSDYDSEEDIEKKFNDYLTLLSKVLDLCLSASSTQIAVKAESQLKEVYQDTKDAFEKIISRNNMMIKIEKSSGDRKTSLLKTLGQKLLNKNLDENAEGIDVYNKIQKDNLNLISSQSEKLKKIIQLLSK